MSAPKHKLSPRQNALAYRIWAHCEPIGWNATAKEIADASGVKHQSIGSIRSAKGWVGRTRVTTAEMFPRTIGGLDAGVLHRGAPEEYRRSVTVQHAAVDHDT